MVRVGHSPLWPKYRPQYFTYKNLYLLDKRSVYNEKGKKVHTYEDYQDLLVFLSGNNGSLFIRDFLCHAQLVSRSINNPYAKVSCRKNGQPTGITIKGKYSTKIGLSTAWGVPNKNISFDIQFLTLMKQTFQHCRVGTQVTSGALGKALQYMVWMLENLERYTAPNMLAQKFIREYATGGRCDTLRTGYVGDTLELDGSSFWLAHCYPLPCGTAIPFTDGCVDGFYTFFARCTVTIKKELALGPFPMRRKDGKITYPTLPGTYETYLWREQCDDCIQAGCTVQVHNGYGWLDCTYAMEYYAQHVYGLRMQVYGTPVEDNLKQAIVAGFGYWAMGGDFYSLTDTPSEGDRFFPSIDGPTDYYIHKEPYDYTVPNMPHWYYYLIMQANRTLYQFSLPYAKQGRLIATNYDAVYVLEQNETRQFVRKYSPEAATVAVGAWRWSRLIDFKVLGDRSYDGQIVLPNGNTKRKLVTPGVSHE